MENGETANAGVGQEKEGAQLSALLDRVSSPYTS